MNFRSSELTSGKLFPAPPPVDRGGNARTVLAGKDSLRALTRSVNIQSCQKAFAGFRTSSGSKVGLEWLQMLKP